MPTVYTERGKLLSSGLVSAKNTVVSLAGAPPSSYQPSAISHQSSTIQEESQVVFFLPVDHLYLQVLDFQYVEGAALSAKRCLL